MAPRQSRSAKASVLPAISAWLIGVVAASALGLAVFVLNGLLGDIQSSNVWGLSYGATATALLLIAAAYGLRRRSVRVATRLGAGSAHLWLSVHTFTGTLFLLLVLMHSGFTLPEGWLTWSLWLLSFWTVLTGFAGLALQRWIPRRLTSGLTIEVHYDRIPELVDVTRTRAEELAATCGETVRGFYERRIADSFRKPSWRWLYFVEIPGRRDRRTREFDFLNKRLAGEESDRLDELRLLFQAKAEIDAHYTLQSALRLWLYLHVPTSVALFALLGVHLFTVFYY